MRRNDLFAVPRRQSIWAIIFIVLKFLRRLFSQLWPILLAVFLGSRTNQFDRFELIIVGLGAFGMIASILSYFKYYYHLSPDKLIIQQGILRKVKLNIPFERIQSINFEQSFLHQMFRVVEVEIETAGSDQKELRIDALTQETAQALREVLLAKRKEFLKPGLASDYDADIIEEDSEQILSLDTMDLLKVGLTQNHLKPVGLLFGLVGSAFAYSFTFDMDPGDLYGMITEYYSQLEFIQGILLLILLILLSVVYSIVTTILRHYHLSFIRKRGKFQVVQGLLTKKEFAAMDRKIQILSWGQNLFERAAGLQNIQFRQATSGDGDRKKTRFRIPGCDDDRVSYVKSAWLKRDDVHFTDLTGVSLHFYLHGAMYIMLFMLVLIGIVVYHEIFQILYILIPVFFILNMMHYFQWKKKKYGLNGHEVYVGGGIFGYRHAIVPLYKIQNLMIRQNMYQWRRDLASLIIFTAAGEISIPYISHEKARQLADILTYHVEVSKKSWM